MGTCLSASFAIGALAQYAIDWHTIDGGGGTSTGGFRALFAGQVAGGRPLAEH